MLRRVRAKWILVILAPTLLLLGGSRALLLADLEPGALELAGEFFHVHVGELVFECERLELGSLEVAALLRSFDERAGLVGLK